jgi:hypothetical protein
LDDPAAAGLEFGDERRVLEPDHRDPHSLLHTQLVEEGLVGWLIEPAHAELSRALVLLEVVQIHGTERLAELAFARVLPVVEHRDQVADTQIRLRLLEVPDGGLGRGDGLDQPPEEGDVHPVLGQMDRSIVQLLRRETLESGSVGHDRRSLPG